MLDLFQHLAQTLKQVQGDVLTKNRESQLREGLVFVFRIPCALCASLHLRQGSDEHVRPSVTLCAPLSNSVE